MELNSISFCRDVIFGLSTCWLMLFHSTEIDFTKSKVIPVIIAQGLNVIKNTGNIGVDIFLIMSGIGLYFSFTKDRDINAFYVRRVKRVIPTVLICSTLWFGIQGINGLKTYLVYVNLGGVYVYGESYFWYFSLLIPLYAIYPAYRLLQDKMKNGIILGFIVIIGWTCILLLIDKTEFFCRAEIALTRVPAFIIGCMLGKPVLKNEKLGKGFIGLISLLLFPLFELYNLGLTTIVRRYTGTIIALITILVLSLVLVKIRNCKMVIIPLAVIGGYSMEIYLLYSAMGMLFKGIFNVSSSTGVAYYIPVATVTFVLSIGLKAVTDKIISLFERKSKSLLVKREV